MELTSKWWETWKQEAQSNPMFHINAIIINHTKAHCNKEFCNNASLNSMTKILHFTKLSSIQSECTPCPQWKGKVKTWCVYELFWCLSDGGSSGYITQEAAVHETSAGHNGMERNTWLQDNTSIHLVTPRFTISRLTSVTLKCTLRLSIMLLIILKRECA